MVNSENGAQDGKYPWANSVSSTSAQIRYCEADGINVCNTHNNEDTSWFAVESGPLRVSGVTSDTEFSATKIEYNNLFTEILEKITNLKIKIDISQFSNLGSNENSNTNPNLKIELFNGNSWTNIGTITPNTRTEYEISTTDSNILKNWENTDNRKLQITPQNFDYYNESNKDEITWDKLTLDIEHSKFSSNWHTTYSDTNLCGTYNITQISSIDNKNSQNITNYLDKTFLVKCIPKINLRYPKNNTKFLSNSEIEFKFKINNPSTSATCNLYIDNNLKETFNCNSGNFSKNYILTGGIHNWSINLTNNIGFKANSTINTFNNIQKESKKITKSITHLGANQFSISTKVKNKIDQSSDSKTQELVPLNFNANSFNPMHDYTNITTSLYSGLIIGWDYTLPANNEVEFTYNIAGTTNYFIKDAYIIGLE